MNLNSVVMTKIRPTVIFDPSNEDHRRHGWLMIKNRSLKDCPWIFALHEGHDNVIDMIHIELARWYAAREFEVDKKRV
jgi:hypothetical protein